MKTRKLNAVLTSLIFIFSMQVSNDATSTNSSSYKWNSTSTRRGFAIPTSADAVFIHSGIALTVNKVSVEGDIIPQLDFVLTHIEN